MIYLSYAELLDVAERAMGDLPVVRDAGLLKAVAARPQSTVLGADVYPSLEEKAAALTHSIVSHCVLVDVDKRLGLGGLIAFLGVNGRRLTLSNDEAYDLITAAGADQLDEVVAIAERIRAATEPCGYVR